MAYQNVGTPRFYINVMEWLHSNGVITIGSRLMTLPVLSDTTGYGTEHSVGVAMSGGKNFHAVLNYSAGSTFQISGASYDAEIVNAGGEYSGFRISTFATSLESIIFEGGGGSLIAGTYYQMPHSPDLSLTLGYETGTKTIETRGGASLSNTMWRPPMWGSLGAWELSDPGSPTPNQTLAHSSRRTWSLSFSFLSDSSVFPKYNALNRLIDQEETLPDDETLLTSDDFFSQVWNKVGTALPFIFQPDKEVAEFAICKFTNNISFQLVAHKLYNCKIRIKEVW